MQIVAALESRGHRRLRADMGSGPHFHQIEIGADEHIAWGGHEQRTEATIARDLLQVRLRAGYPSGDGAGDPIVRVNATSDRRNPRRQSDVERGQRLIDD